MDINSLYNEWLEKATVDPDLIAELERNYRINEDVLRFIVIKYENKKEQKAWQTLVDRANNKPEPKKQKAESTPKDSQEA